MYLGKKVIGGVYVSSIDEKRLREIAEENERLDWPSSHVPELIAEIGALRHRLAREGITLTTPDASKLILPGFPNV